MKPVVIASGGKPPGFKSVLDLQCFTAGDFTNAVVDAAYIRAMFELCDAMWLHSGDPKDPHAELTGGKCSDGFIDTLRVLRFTNLCDIFGMIMAKMIKGKAWELGFDPRGINWVIGSDHAGAVFSYSVAKWLGVLHDFTEKEQVAGSKKQLWKRFPIEPGHQVLQVEELVTTTTTLKNVREGIRAGNSEMVSHPASFVPMVATLIHRSKEYKFEGDPILYLAHFDIQTWDPAECPLCAAGSKRIRPKQNWAELTGKRQ